MSVLVAADDDAGEEEDEDLVDEEDEDEGEGKGYEGDDEEVEGDEDDFEAMARAMDWLGGCVRFDAVFGGLLVGEEEESEEREND